MADNRHEGKYELGQQGTPVDINADEIQVGDILDLPDVDENFVTVDEVTEGGVDGQPIVVQLSGGPKQGEQVALTVPWTQRVSRLGNLNA